MINYQLRLEKLQNSIKNLKVDGLLIEDQTDLFYLTGLHLSAGTLFVDKNGAELFVDGRYIESCKKNCPFPVILSDFISLEAMLKKSSMKEAKTVAFDSTTTSYSQYEKFKKNSHITLIPLEAPLKLQRAIKDAFEIEALRKAAILGYRGFEFVSTLLKEGISEQECAQELELFWKKQGSQGLAFESIIAFGKNSSMPHHRAGKETLKLNDIALIDIGVNLDNYNSDMTRVVFFNKPHKTLLAIHDIVEQAQLEALKLCREGVLIGDIDKAARKYITDKGYGNNFNHNLGHGIGLNIHEYPSIKNVPPFDKTPLKAGMVITIEPGIYLPGIGGVRIEDSIVITKKGYENLTRFH